MIWWALRWIEPILHSSLSPFSKVLSQCWGPYITRNNSRIDFRCSFIFYHCLIFSHIIFLPSATATIEEELNINKYRSKEQLESLLGEHRHILLNYSGLYNFPVVDISSSSLERNSRQKIILSVSITFQEISFINSINESQLLLWTQNFKLAISLLGEILHKCYYEISAAFSTIFYVIIIKGNSLMFQ